ncbi:MAG TPA: glycosyltransferase [Pyrinomonadaceae bacterium]|jgi:glycosyltransferase involved in cell wall biosynthesis
MKPNVLLFIDSFNQGGTERQVVQLARLLKECGRYNVHLACLKPEGVLRAEAERAGFKDIPEFRLKSFKEPEAFRQARRFARLLREREISLVETHDFYTNIFGMAGAAMARVPVRIASRRETDGVRTTAQKWTERRAFNLAHAIIANSNAVRRQLIRDGVPGEKIVTVYNGMDTVRVAPLADFNRGEVLASLGLPVDAERRFVTIVANMRHPMKDQKTFLRAARLVRDEVPDAAFVLAGEGELTEGLRSLASELGLESDAFFIGRCAEVSALLAVSEVCVLSSKGVEGFSNSIVEYMAAARPVVATDVGGAAEQIVEGETGYIVEPEDAATMAARIISLLKDRARAREMGGRGLKRVQTEFSCEAQLERTEALYERLLTRASGKLKLSKSGALEARREDAGGEGQAIL